MTGRLINGDGKVHTCFTRLPGVRDSALKVLTRWWSEGKLKGMWRGKERLGKEEGRVTKKRKYQ